MEPPAKRRRQGPSPLKNNTEPTEDANDDRPEDDGHQLAIKRAQADHKLQATFAHIIEKYSQDFDGIGDEIDMETGEIVVNNGHLSGMRHEGDLGGGAWPDDASDGYGDQGDDDDEGILLEDLTDEMLNADDEDVSEIQDSEEADNEDPTETDSHEDELVLPGREIVSKPTSLVPQSGSGAFNMPGNFLGAQVEALNSLFPNLYGSLFVGFLPAPGKQLSGFAPGFGLPQLNNGTSPVSYGQPVMGHSPNPFLVGPWAMPGHLPPQAWGQPEMPVQQQLFPKQHTKKSTEERYKFPTQKGDTSIWAPRSRQQDDDKPVPLPKGRPRGPRKPREQKRDISHLPNDDGKSNSKNDAGSGGDNRRDRRLSGRVRKQVKYMGKISWQEAENDRGLNMNESSQLSDSDSDSDPLALYSSQGSQETTSQSLGVTTPKSAQAIRKVLRPGSIGKQNLGRVVPDSQDSATPPGSSAPQSSGPKEDDTHIDKPNHTSANSAAKLSDDEAPIVLPIRKTPEILTGLEPAPNIDGHNLGGDEPEPVLTLDKPKKRDRGRPRKPLSAEAESESGRAKTVLGLPPLRLSREMKWLQASLQNTPKPMPVLDLSNAAEETVQEQGLGYAKRVRSVTSRASIKLDNIPVEEPEEIEEADGTDGIDGLEGANEDEEAGETGEAEEAEDVEDAEETGDAELTSSAAAIERTTPPNPPPSPSPATASPPAKKASSRKQDESSPQATQAETPRRPPNPKRKNGPIHNSSQATPQKLTHTLSKPHTPRLTSIRTSRAPSSRRSILSLISADSDSDSDKDLDELGRPSPSLPRSAGASTIKAWRSSALTTEALRTPSRKRHGEPVSPGSVVRTPGGTMRACGVSGFRCGRDFCFSCL
ncbi:hypothetical protein QQX98_007894 [Neonectria punicea]|uniref:Myb-like DNA-binding domain protein n=1 Tax=Neonectria punicea TaxID=979145 RepID=A0ABR1GWL9_9HYPO